MEKPILFNTEMVKAILEGRKTTTRRITKFKPYTALNETKGDFEICEPVTQNFFRCRLDFEKWAIQKCSYKVGDIVYVRETWCNAETDIKPNNDFENVNCKYIFKVDDNGEEHPLININIKRWRPSIHMPKTAARIFLKVINVKVEMLQEITEDGAKAEGTTYPIVDAGNNVLEDGYRLRFSDLWNSLYKNWDENPWVWIIEFEKLDNCKI